MQEILWIWNYKCGWNSLVERALDWNYCGRYPHILSYFYTLSTIVTDYRKIEGKNYVQQVEEKCILSIYIYYTWRIYKNRLFCTKWGKVESSSLKIRNKNPLSSLLFKIVLEVLTRAIRKEGNKGIWIEERSPSVHWKTPRTNKYCQQSGRVQNEHEKLAALLYTKNADIPKKKWLKESCSPHNRMTPLYLSWVLPQSISMSQRRLSACVHGSTIPNH